LDLLKCPVAKSSPAALDERFAVGEPAASRIEADELAVAEQVAA